MKSQQKIVAVCLAAWQHHTGIMEQEDKEAFESALTYVDSSDEYQAAQALLEQRLFLTGFDGDVHHYCEQLLQPYQQQLKHAPLASA